MNIISLKIIIIIIHETFPAEDEIDT